MRSDKGDESGVIEYHLISLEFEAVRSILVNRLLHSGCCFLEESLNVRQLGEEARQDLPNR